MRSFVHQPLRPVGDRSEIFQMLFGKISVFIFLQSFSDVHDLIIIAAQDKQIPAVCVACSSVRPPDANNSARYSVILS